MLPPWFLFFFFFSGFTEVCASIHLLVCRSAPPGIWGDKGLGGKRGKTMVPVVLEEISGTGAAGRRPFPGSDVVVSWGHAGSAAHGKGPSLHRTAFDSPVPLRPVPIQHTKSPHTDLVGLTHLHPSPRSLQAGHWDPQHGCRASRADSLHQLLLLSTPVL